MLFFKPKPNNDMEIKLLVKRTLTTMKKQIEVLEAQKKLFLDKAVEAKNKGLTSQVRLAIGGYKQTEAQLRHAEEMLLSFEIAAQLKDVTAMTVDFLESMSALSKEMGKLTGGRSFAGVEHDFKAAMAAAGNQADHLDAFMDMSKKAFSEPVGSTGSVGVTDEEIEALLAGTAAASDAVEADPTAPNDEETDKEIAELKKKISEML